MVIICQASDFEEMLRVRPIKVEASNLVLLDGFNSQAFILPLLVVTAHNPLLWANFVKPFVIRLIVFKALPPVIFDVERGIENP